jgi:5-methylcytosine-specific restriction endonuclease McrA
MHVRRQRLVYLHKIVEIYSAAWVAAGRACSYCDAPASTVDHVISLKRGGTNYEGNLTPACRSCNSSKSDKLLVEWRRVKAA